MTSLLKDEQTSKLGGEGRYDAILELKGEQIKNVLKERKKKMRKKKKERKRNMRKRKKI
jgi:hypothetical protein